MLIRSSQTGRRTFVIAWVASLLVGVLLYVLSFGPACWIVTRTSVPDGSWPHQTFCFVYGPVTNAVLWTPESLEGVINWYVGLGSPAGKQMEIWTYPPMKGRPGGRLLYWTINSSGNGCMISQRAR